MRTACIFYLLVAGPHPRPFLRSRGPTPARLARASALASAAGASPLACTLAAVDCGDCPLRQQSLYSSEQHGCTCRLRARVRSRVLRSSARPLDALLQRDVGAV